MRSDWLRSQGLGLVCGQVCVVLLGVGSVVIAATREGASRDLQLDDLRPFFTQPTWVHAWFYLLLAVIALYALNTALCTWDSVRARLGRGGGEVSGWGPTVIHVSWLVALLSHLVGGLTNTELAPVLLTREWAQVDEGLEVRLTGLTNEVTPSGKLKQTHAALEVRAAGAVSVEELGYNQPVTRGLGRELLLLSQAGRAPGVATFALGEARCQTLVPGPCSFGGTIVEVVDLQRVEHLGGRLAAVVQVGSDRFPLAEGGARDLPGGTLRFEGVSTEDVVQVRHRHAPGNPVALVSAVLLTAGLLLMGRRWLRPVADGA